MLDPLFTGERERKRNFSVYTLNVSGHIDTRVVAAVSSPCPVSFSHSMPHAHNTKVLYFYSLHSWVKKIVSRTCVFMSHLTYPSLSKCNLHCRCDVPGKPQHADGDVKHYYWWTLTAVHGSLVWVAAHTQCFIRLQLHFNPDGTRILHKFPTLDGLA